MGTSAQPPEGRWSERGAAYAVSREHVAGPSLPKLLALADPRPGDRCLDVGTGAGHTAACLARAGAEVVGLDPAPGMLEAARRHYGALPGLRFVEAPGDATGLPAGAFDVVTARHTLHHHADPGATLREIARVLRPGGRFVLVDEITPDPRVDAWLDAVSRTRDATHVRAYSLDAWRAMLATAGLLWVVGDTDTRYRMEVDAWLDAVSRTRDATHVRAYSLDAWRAMLATAGLLWVVGDTDTRYRMEVDAWIGRMDLADTEQAAVRRLFREAGPLERRLFTIEYDAGEAVRFALPMAVVLATRPAEGETA